MCDILKSANINKIISPIFGTLSIIQASRDASARINLLADKAFMLVIKFNSCYCGGEHPRARFSRKVSSNNVCTAFRGRMRKYCTRGNQNYKENISKKVILAHALACTHECSSKFLSGRNVFGHPFDILRGGKTQLLESDNGQHSDNS